LVERVEFGFVDPVVLFDLGIEPFERFEIQALMRVIQRLAEIQIFQLLAVTWTRCQTSNQQESEHGMWCSTHDLPVSDLDSITAEAWLGKCDSERLRFDTLGECERAGFAEILATV
jgi:hypothetical protein